MKSKPKPKIDFHVYAGSVRGALAYTQCKTNINPKYDIQEVTSEITAMEWGRSEEEILIGNKNGDVKLYDTITSKYTKRNIDGLKGEGPVVGLGCFEQNLIAGRRNGIINIWNDQDNESFSTNLTDESTMECMIQNKLRNVVACGGEKNDLKVWDVEKQTDVFKAKSMGNDELNLHIWTSVRGICFFPLEEKLVACASKEGHVLLYDERVQRRPVAKYVEPKACYSVMCTAYKDRQCLVGTTRGYLQWIDLRQNKILKTFKAFTGGITSIVCDPTQPIVACTSLDRHLRIIHLETKEMLHKEYLKLSLTKLLMKPIVKKEEVEMEEQLLEGVDVEEGEQQNEEVVVEKLQSKEEKELDDIFDNIEEIVEEVDVKKRKKRKTEKKNKKKKLKSGDDD